MAAKVPARLLDLQRRNNLATADAWDLFAPHRARVTALVREAGGRTLLVMGAGNANDLELAELASELRAIHLADLDAAALARAHARLPADARAAVKLHAPVDLTGALSRLDRWADTTISPAAMTALPESAAEQVVAAFPEAPFDTVLSACVLSQILHTCGRALGTGHPQLRETAGALVAAHLRSLLRLCAPGGTVLLVTDVASSQTYPLEELWDSQPPQALLDQLVRTGNVFTGADPAFVGRVLAAHPQVGPLVGQPDGVRFVEPWLWTLSDELTVMVYAVRVRRAAAP